MSGRESPYHEVYDEYKRYPSRSPSADSRSRSRSLSSASPPYKRRSSKRSPTPPRRKPRRHSASRSRSRSYSRSRSRSRGRKRYNSRSRSRSRSYHSRSRSRSRGRRNRGRYRSRSPFSHRKRHQGNRFNPKASKVIGVFGLSLCTGEKDLRELFDKYGPIDRVQVVYDHQTGRSRGFAFIYFVDVEDAIDAKERCNGMEVEGRRIRVDYSITKRPHTPTPGVYMGRPTRSNDDRSPDDNYQRGRGNYY